MDVRTALAAREYAALRPATEPDPAQAGAGASLRAATEDFAATLRKGEEAAMASMTGDADPHALVMALAQSELAVQTVVSVRDKVVEAYQEILRMPV
ncbi:flagellar hook-basal body complex protein FliE [Rhodosalinus halophilus]|uniref:Flagellar hook-basal body complex protein FliE n=1 Tax=Rhodosalinus halophilus TaxID=2259333 RepID=A0A365U7Y3_9RHOB|nr:flagellar hook-basal body complex protein FliE [Rhodosalinus halophilus]RBI84737.1 flagellar hook-basal body complex protein FliE [Rhodosalinus halophilus]